MLKNAYVSAIRAIRPIPDRLGLLASLERRAPRSRTARWLRSLFAIYDIDDLTALDLPWWTLDAVVEADRFLAARKSPRVFEYGSGASTVWLARRAASVISIEHDPGWYSVVANHVARFPNATVHLVEADATFVSGYRSTKEGWVGRSFQRYVNAIDEAAAPFDLIVIDGRARPDCLAHAVRQLAPEGMILFDNSGRKRYREAIEKSGLTARRFRGLTACLPYPDETTLLRLPAA